MALAVDDVDLAFHEATRDRGAQKERLRYLDRILAELEWCNLKDLSLFPETKRKLEEEGIDSTKSITVLIESVWEVQREYMIKLPREPKQRRKRRKVTVNQVLGIFSKLTPDDRKRLTAMGTEVTARNAVDLAVRNVLFGTTTRSAGGLNVHLDTD